MGSVCNKWVHVYVYEGMQDMKGVLPVTDTRTGAVKCVSEEKKGNTQHRATYVL